MKSECYCPKCKWEGNGIDASVKRFGAYCGVGSPENWGWEEWDDLVCPKCGSVIEYNEELI